MCCSRSQGDGKLARQMMQRTPGPAPAPGPATGPGPRRSPEPVPLTSSRRSRGGDVSRVGCCSSDRMGPEPGTVPGGAAAPMVGPPGPPGPGPGGGMGPPHGLKAVPKVGKGNWKGVEERLLDCDSLSLGLELDVHGPP